MDRALFRVRLADGSTRWAAGEGSPEQLLGPDVSLERLLGERADLAAVAASSGELVPDDARTVAPIGSQEVWAAGVTYLRSRQA